MQPNTLLLTAPAQPLLLAAWSVTTPAYKRCSNPATIYPDPPKGNGPWFLRDNSAFNAQIGWAEVGRLARQYKELGI